MILATHYGEPSYWLNPDLPDLILYTAYDLIREAQDDNG